VVDVLVRNMLSREPHLCRVDTVDGYPLMLTYSPNLSAWPIACCGISLSTQLSVVAERVLKLRLGAAVDVPARLDVSFVLSRRHLENKVGV
jgi:hypothetical protein